MDKKGFQPPGGVSVVIPVYNDNVRLKRCLRAVKAGDGVPEDGPDGVEIIVVDDGSPESPQSVVDAEGVRMIVQQQWGPASARNTGASAARGEIVAFTDADCTPSDGWLTSLLERFEDSEVIGVKGTYSTHQTSLVSRFVQQEYEAKYRRMAELEKIDFVDTYSCAYRRDVFLENGGFDTAFPVPSVEDQELSFRLAKKGYTMVFAPGAMVYHEHDRNLWEYLRRKFGIGYWKAFMLRWVPEKLFSDSHTLPSQRLQIGFMFIAIIAALAALLWPLMGWVALGAMVLFFAIDLPFLGHILRTEPRLILVAPFLLIARAGALGAGLLVGFLIPPRKQTKETSGPSPLVRGVKRAMDIVGGLLGSLISLPFLAAAAVAIKIDSPGSIFFRQERVGEHGKPFTIVKLRTMVEDAEDRVEEALERNQLEGPVFKVPDDPRITPVGRLLRRWSIDELPQFWKVLIGTMSLVGPRPEETWVVAQYNDDERLRLAVKPGMTGPFQIAGRGSLNMEERLALELAYIQDYSLWRDVEILAKTLPAVLRGEGAF